VPSGGELGVVHALARIGRTEAKKPFQRLLCGVDPLQFLGNGVGRLLREGFAVLFEERERVFQTVGLLRGFGVRIGPDRFNALVAVEGKDEGDDELRLKSLPVRFIALGRQRTERDGVGVQLLEHVLHRAQKLASLHRLKAL